MALDPGVIINHRYRILSILGQGGMGSVYRAMDMNLSVEVALKENLYLTDEYTRQFKREAAILATLRHPNLPKVTDHFEIPGQGQYLVMEFITGEDLRERMDREGVMAEAEVIHIGVSICDALTYLHSRSPAVLHRDIKPGNIRITDEGHVLLVDFGLAKLHLGNQETTSGARAMTPGYSPPEQYGSARTDSRSDIYSLGATLYAALGGAAPEDSLSQLTDFTSLTNIRSLNPKVSKRMAAVLEKALELRPEDRYQSADDMKIALLKVIGEKPLSHPITITPPPASPLYTVKSEPAPIRQMPSGFKKKPKHETKNLAVIAFFATLMIVGVVAALIIILVQSGYITRPTAIASNPNVPVANEPTFAETDTISEGASNPAVQLATIPYSNEGLPMSTGEAGAEVPEGTKILSANTNEGGGEIAFASMRSGYPQIWLMNGDGSSQRQLTNMKEGACQPDWSPTGKQVVFVSPCMSRGTRYEKSSLFIINTDGTNLTILDDGVGGSYDPNWSSDGTKIAFTKEVSTFTQVYAIDITTGVVSGMVDDTVPSRQPAWSPDGKKIAYVGKKYNTDYIWILDLETNEKWQLTNTKNQNNTQPSWAPDGMTIYFTKSSIADYNPSFAGVTYSYGTAGLEYSIPITNHPIPSPAGDGDLSSDGKWLVFESWPDGKNHDIYKMTLSGEVVIRLTEDSKLDFHPSWKP